MKETTFINQNKKKWATFEKMSQTQQNDPDEMSRLFVELTDDLAYARTYYPKRSVRVYLNSLAQKVFHDLYKKKREPLSKFVKFWTTDLPLEMFRARYSLLTAFVIFALGMLIGIVSTIDNEDFLGAVIGYDYVDMAEQNIANGKPMNVYGEGQEVDGFVMIAINNMRVAMITFILGIFFSMGSGVFLFFNSIMVGAFQWFYVVRGLTLASFLTIWIHGAFEIPAIILAAAAGITMGNGILFPGTLTRGQSLIKSAKRGVKIMIGIIPFILIAAFIEGFATRHTVVTTHGTPLESEWPDALKWVFILSCFAIVLFYFVFYPRYVAKKHNFDGKVIEKPQYVERKQLEIYKIKDLGELFTDTFLAYAKVLVPYLKLFLLTLPLNIWYVFLLFDQVPFFYYNDMTDPLRILEAPADNLAITFAWEGYFSWDLFLIQSLVFTLNGYGILYLVKNILFGDKKFSIKDFLKGFAKASIPLFLAVMLMGVIAVNVTFPLLLFLGALSPFIFMWALPVIVSNEKFGTALQHGFAKSWKSFGNGIGLFFALLVTLFIIYMFASFPIEIFTDMVAEWIVLPLAKEPQYVINYIQVFTNLIVSHLIFPIFFIGYTMHYFSLIEKEEAKGMYHRLKTFGKKSKIYETADEGAY